MRDTTHGILDILRWGQDQPSAKEELMAWQITCMAAVLLGAAKGNAAPEKYPASQMLIESAELARPEATRKFRILDTRSLEKYKAGHVPLASTIETARWSRDFADGPDQETWEKRLKALGISDETPVAVYGDDLRETARVWWILHFWGVKDVRILNGGWRGWQAARGKIHKGLYTEPYYPPTDGKITPRPQRLAIKDQLLKGLKDKRFQIADARSKAEYCGETKTARRNGSIPEAKRLEWSDLIDRKTQRFKSPAELKRLIKAAGIDLDRPTVTYCQSGGRASVLAFALELMGAKNVRNYYRSWAEWGNASDTPVEKPKPKE
jgi:thiosulfate/3-mercaptopyruvate sulfurtransferase